MFLYDYESVNWRLEFSLSNCQGSVPSYHTVNSILCCFICISCVRFVLTFELLDFSLMKTATILVSMDSLFISETVSVYFYHATNVHMYSSGEELEEVTCMLN